MKIIIFLSNVIPPATAFAKRTNSSHWLEPPREIRCRQGGSPLAGQEGTQRRWPMTRPRGRERSEQFFATR
ncbi:hypothetical protein ACMA1I_22000 [Pontibacter sp. 13R65]|uniref:hypothetical protein n=1 Tax=Pontibacter sp. 13R65 TaxID=3127458 RepID=UPI00301D1B03